MIHIVEYGSACLWPVSNSFALFSAQTCNKYDVETRKPHSLKTFFSDSALICAVSALEYYVRHVTNVFGITATLVVVLLSGFALPHHTLITTISNVSAGGKPVDSAQPETSV